MRDCGGEQRSPHPTSHRRRRPHRSRKVRSGRLSRPAPRRRGRQRRLDAALPRDGHRHRQADARGTRRRPAPSPGHLGRDRRGERRRVPAARPRADRPAARRGALAGPGRRLRAVRPGSHRQPGVPRHRSRGHGPAWRRSSPCAAPVRCTPAWPPPTPRPRRRSCPATAAVSSGRWRSSRSPASPSPPTFRATTPCTTPCRSASTWPAPSSTSASPAGSTGCGMRGSWTRCARWRRTGCARGARPRARSATSRCSRRSPGSATEDEARAETVRATKRFARRQDSWFRRDPRVHWLSGAAADLTELPHLALALVERPVTA